jgi:hypothetical protein
MALFGSAVLVSGLWRLSGLKSGSKRACCARLAADMARDIRLALQSRDDGDRQGGPRGLSVVRISEGISE